MEDCVDDWKSLLEIQRDLGLERLMVPYLISVRYGNCPWSGVDEVMGQDEFEYMMVRGRDVKNCKEKF